MLQTILNFIGIAVFAASGAVVGVRKGFDIFGIAVMGVLTGVGGGILRDLLLDISPPHSIQHWPNITAALVAAAMATVFAHVVIRLNSQRGKLVHRGTAGNAVSDRRRHHPRRAGA